MCGRPDNRSLVDRRFELPRSMIPADATAIIRVRMRKWGRGIGRLPGVNGDSPNMRPARAGGQGNPAGFPPRAAPSLLCPQSTGAMDGTCACQRESRPSHARGTWAVDAPERRTRETIATHGWQVIKVPEDDEQPGFAYSVGLHTTFGHAEVIVFGLELDLMHRMLNNIGEEIRSGQRFAPGDLSPEVLEDSDVVFRRVERRYYDEYLGYAQRIHHGDGFAAIQMVWPDSKGRFPWDTGFPRALRARQPMLDGS